LTRLIVEEKTIASKPRVIKNFYVKTGLKISELIEALEILLRIGYLR
jgi:hypothetical protein